MNAVDTKQGHVRSMTWLEPEPAFIPRVASLAEFKGRRIAFNIGGYWQYYPSFATEREYREALDLLVQGAWLALADAHPDSVIGVSTDPFGVEWSGCLLPLWDWTPDEGLTPEWHPSVVQYAELFVEGCMDRHYTGGCISRSPESALRLCADLVIRNYAPYSWLISGLRGGVSVYFHNTTSFGVCVPDDCGSDIAVLTRDLQRLGLEGSVISG
jgi:hypothetical protein